MFSQLLKSKVSRVSINLKMYLGLGVPTMFLSAVIMQETLKNKKAIKLDAANTASASKKSSVAFNNMHNQQNKSNINNPAIKNLVFQGGGPRGIAYVGALEGLKNQIGDDFSKIERVAGTSSGAITASLLSVGYTPEKIKELLAKTDFKKLVLTGNDSRDKVLIDLGNSSTASSGIRMFGSALWTGIKAPITTASLINEIRTSRGISSGDKFREWLDDAIADKVAEIEGGNKKRYKYLTFGELKKLQEEKPDKYKKLYIVGAVFDSKNNELEKPNIYSSDNPTMSNYIISDAVRISMSIPFVFVPHGLHYLSDKDKRERKIIETTTDIAGGIDGGVLKNYPIDIFDYNKYLSEPLFDKTADAKIFNPETLGFMLIDKSTTDFKTFLNKVRGAIDNMDKRNLEPLQLNEQSDISRDIKIDTLNVTMFDFDLPEQSIANLQQSGANAVKQFWGAGEKEALFAQQKEYVQTSEKIKRELTNKFTSNLHENVPHYQISDNYLSMQNIVENLSNDGKNQIHISGISGSGKTQLALYAAAQHIDANLHAMWKSKYDWKGQNNNDMPVFWFINAENQATLTASLQNLAKHLECRTISDDVEELYENIFFKLSRKSRYLLVMDNLVNNKLAKGCFDNLGKNGLLIVTTQDKNQSSNQLSGCVYVDLDGGLSDAAAATLVEELCPRLKNDKAVGLLIKKFYNLPLALTSAAYYLNHDDNKVLSIEKYLHLWDKQFSQLAKEQAKVMSNPNLKTKNATQESAITMSIDKIKGITAQSLLMHYACLAPNISKSMLQDLLKVDAEELNNAIEELRAYSLIRSIPSDVAGDGLFMHRLIQKVASERYMMEDKFTVDWYESLLKRIHSIKEKDITGEHDYYNKQYLLPHFETIFEKINMPVEKYSRDLIRGYIDMCLLYKAVGAAQQAVDNYIKILPWIEHNANEQINKDIVVDFYVGLGRAYQGGPGAFGKARECYEKAYKVYTNGITKELKPDTKVAEILNDIGMACYDLGCEIQNKEGKKSDSSISLFNEALKHIERAVSETLSFKDKNTINMPDMNFVRYKGNLCKVYRKLDDFDNAEKCIKEAIENGTKRDHRSVASAHFDFGKLYLSKAKKIANNNQEQAKEFLLMAKNSFENAIKIDQEIFKNKKNPSEHVYHPLEARHTDALGKSWRKLGDENKACEKFEEASKILTLSRGAQKQLREKIEKHLYSCSRKTAKLKHTI